ncbi:MAG: type II toxin-antitoxin system YafQ family toxin [Verrucomicrobiales bacterium]|jgi:mRNA interferase YafQ|nr:type II toxin-antitoxin system YafQ family toxin [Verrucomicrobiales bacterium]
MRVKPQERFKKDMLRYRHDRSALKDVDGVIQLLKTGEPLPAEYDGHALHGEWVGYLECHCQADLLLVYQRKKNEIRLARLGRHAELFRKRQRSE